MRRARRLYAGDPTPLDLDANLFAPDATVIELNLALFPWARWKTDHASVKLNVLLDLRADVPVFASRRSAKEFLDRALQRRCEPQGHGDIGPHAPGLHPG